MTFFASFIGLILGLYFLRNNIVLSLVVSLAFIIFVFFRFEKKKAILIVAFFAIGMALPVISQIHLWQNGQYPGLVIESNENYFIFQSGFQKYYVYEKAHCHEIGDYLLIVSEPGPIKISTYESQFSFVEYLFNKGVEQTLDASNIQIKFASPFHLQAIREKFLANFSLDSRDFIAAFLFNNKNYENSTLIAASEMNLIFLLSMSGIYLSFLLEGMRKICKLFLKDKYADIIPFLVLFPYSIFVFPKVGVIRVMSIYLFRYFNTHILNKRFSSLALISLVGITLLLLDFHFAYQSSCYVGFLLAFGLTFLRPSLNRYKKKKQAFLLPLLIHLLLFPLVTFTSGEWHVFALLFQTLLIPFNEIFIIFSLISFYVGYPFKVIISNLSNVLSIVYRTISPYDFTLYVGDFSVYFIPLFYLGYFYLLHLFESHRILHLKLGSLPLVSGLTIALIPLRLYIVNAVYFINVGQGDSILVKNREHIVMIDTGGNKKIDLAKETLIPFLHKKQIDHIDALRTTHDDFDHAGAATSLMNNFPVYHHLSTDSDFPYSIGDIYLNNLNTYKANDENDKSLVFNFSFMDKKWLFMGDASVNVEKHLLEEKVDVNCDILKVGHHGSKTSSCAEFIEKASPTEAIVSVGAKNYYGHPNEEVLNRLEKYKVRIRRTDIEGSISYLQITL